jgi:hypothetical protein
MLRNQLQTESNVHTAEPNLERGSWNPGTVPNQVSTGVRVLYYGLPLSQDPRSLVYASVGGPQELDVMSESF